MSTYTEREMSKLCKAWGASSVEELKVVLGERAYRRVKEFGPVRLVNYQDDLDFRLSIWNGAWTLFYGSFRVGQTPTVVGTLEEYPADEPIATGTLAPDCTHGDAYELACRLVARVESGFRAAFG